MRRRGLTAVWRGLVSAPPERRNANHRSRMPQNPLGEKLRADRFFQLGVLFVTLVVAAAVLAPWLAPHDPLSGDLRGAYLLSPGSRFWLGTDTQGRDVLSRILYGA